jgi:hypothetical protein
MKVSDLNNINEIDRSIQHLLNELTTLYQERERLFKNPKKSSRTRKNSPDDLSNIDFNKFDLNLRD